MYVATLCVGASAARAQQPVPDTTRARRDTVAPSVPVPPRPDSIRVDSTPRSTVPGGAVPIKVPPRDTIKAPLSRSESPVLGDIGPEYRWTRDELFASGALTLLDLLDRVPGITGYRAGWIGVPMEAAYLGDVGRTRVFLDGLELDPLDPRTQGVAELSRIPLWTLEEVAIERDAAEVRIHLRTWRVERTTANTRTDVYTGDEETNLYRGFYGKRYPHGEALQLAAQQYSTKASRLGGDADALDLFARVGWARRRWSADALLQRAHRSSDSRGRTVIAPSLAGLDARYTEAYVRAGYGDTSLGPWLQVVASSLAFSESSTQVTASGLGSTGTPLDSADSSGSRAQYLVSGGASLGPVRASATYRARVFNGEHSGTPSARLALATRLLAVSLFGEYRALDEVYRRDLPDLRVTADSAAPSLRGAALPRVTRLGATARLAPLSFIALSGAANRTNLYREGASSAGTPASTMAYRGELGLRLWKLWLSGGVMHRDSAAIASPGLFDTAYRYDTLGTRRADGPATADFATMRGTVYKAIRIDGYAVRWRDGGGIYRPDVQTRATLSLETRWLNRFPSGSFGINVGVTHEYRGFVRFPSAVGDQIAAPSRPISTLVELRLVNAVISWQLRNVVGSIYELVPGFAQPRQTSVYGVRWDFWN